MKMGMVELGPKGSNMVGRLLGAGRECVVFDIDPQAALGLAKAGATATRSLAELIAKVEPPRAIMVPAAAVNSTLAELAPRLTSDDAIIDGGNSYYHDDIRKSPDLSGFSGRMSDSGEGRWTFKAAIAEGVPAPVLGTALTPRFASRGDEEFADKLPSALRYQFGGHEEKHS